MRKPAKYLLNVLIIVCIARQMSCADKTDWNAAARVKLQGNPMHNESAGMKAKTVDDVAEAEGQTPEPALESEGDDKLKIIAAALESEKQKVVELTQKGIQDAAKARTDQERIAVFNDEKFRGLQEETERTKKLQEETGRKNTKQAHELMQLTERLKQLNDDVARANLKADAQNILMQELNATKIAEGLVNKNDLQHKDDAAKLREQIYDAEIKKAVQNALKDYQEQAAKIKGEEARNHTDPQEPLISQATVPWYGNWTGTFDGLRDGINDVFFKPWGTSSTSKPANSFWANLSFPINTGVNLLQQISEFANILFSDIQEQNANVFQVDFKIRGGAFRFGGAYLIVFAFAHWWLRTKHEKIHMTRGSMNIVGDGTSVHGEKNLFRSMSVINSVDNVLAQMGYGLIAQIHPLFSMPCLALYFNATREEKAVTWRRTITGFFRADNMFRCISIVIRALLTLDSIEIAIACIVTAYYGVPRLFKNESDVLVNVAIIGETCEEVLKQLYIAIQDAGPNKIFTFASKNGIATLFQINFLIDILMILDMKSSQQRPNVTWMTGTTMKIKALCPIYFLWTCGSFRMIHRMTPASVFWNTMSTFMNLSWHTLANPIVRFLLDVLQALTPVITWTGLLGSYHYNFFPKTIRINHFLAAWRGEPDLTAEAASEEDGMFLLVVAVMVFMWMLMLYCLDDRYKKLKKSFYCNAWSALCDPYRLHVQASTLVWVAVKWFLLFGRPLGLFLSNMATDHTLQWPQTVVCIFCYDTLLNLMWACQFVVVNVAPGLVGHCSFQYYTQIVCEPCVVADTDIPAEEWFLIEEQVRTSYLSLWRDDTVDHNSLRCVAVKFEVPEVKLMMSELFAYFGSATSKEASVYTKGGLDFFRVGREHSDHTDKETRENVKSDQIHFQQRAILRAHYQKHDSSTSAKAIAPAVSSARSQHNTASQTRAVSNVSYDSDDDGVTEEMLYCGVRTTSRPRTHNSPSTTTFSRILRQKVSPVSETVTVPDVVSPLKSSLPNDATYGQQLKSYVCDSLIRLLQGTEGSTKVSTK